MIASWYVYGIGSKRYIKCELSGLFATTYNHNYHWYGNLEGRSKWKLKVAVL